MFVLERLTCLPKRLGNWLIYVPFLSGAIYTSKLFDIIAKHLPRAHSFADDTQLYVSFSPKEEDGQSSAIIAMERWIIDIKKWMAEDKLLLNDAKTEFLVIGTRQQLSMININSIKIGDADIVPESPATNTPTCEVIHKPRRQSIYVCCP